MQEMRRKDRELPSEQAWEVLRKSDYGFLSMIGVEGEPYCVPLSYAVEGDTVYIHTGRKGYKLDCLRKNPRACFSAVLYHQNVPEAFTMNFASCIAEGSVRFVTDDAERVQGIRAIVAKYSGQYLDTASFEKEMRGMPAVEILALKVEEIKGRAPHKMIDFSAMMGGHPGTKETEEA